MKALLIGVGRFGRNHLRNLAQILGPENVFAAELDLKSAQAAAQAAGVPAGNIGQDYRELLGQVDMVDLVTSTQSHFDIAVHCLEAGKDVFIEKPMTETAAQAARIVELADACDAIVQPGHIFRFNPATRTIKDHLDAGNLGESRIFKGSFGGFKRPRTDIGVAWTDGIHFYDLASYFFGQRPTLAQCRAYEFLPRGGLEDWASVCLEFPGGQVAQVDTEYYYPGKSRDVTVVGSKGAIRADMGAQKVEFFKQEHLHRDGVWSASEPRTIRPEIITQEPLALELRAFVKSVETREPPLVTARAAHDLACIVEGIYESLRLRREVEIIYG